MVAGLIACERSHTHDAAFPLKNALQHGTDAGKRGVAPDGRNSTHLIVRASHWIFSSVAAHGVLYRDYLSELKFGISTIVPAIAVCHCGAMTELEVGRRSRPFNPPQSSARSRSMHWAK